MHASLEIFEWLESTNDIWIAAETMEIGGRLCSCDRHFANVPMLNLTFCDDL